MATKQSDKQADDAPDTTKSARTAETPKDTKQTASTQTTGDDANDPVQSGVLSTAGPDATATVESGKDQDFGATPTGSPPGEHVFPEHTAEDPEGVLDMVGDGDGREALSPPKGPEKPSKNQIEMELWTLVRNELAADKPFVRDRIDQLVAKLGGPDRS
jgi:hypothetical protein